MGVRPRRTGPEAGTNVPAAAEDSLAQMAKWEEDGVEEASRMKVSCEGGGNWGRDIARREADNLWVHGMPGGLDSTAGDVNYL